MADEDLVTRLRKRAAIRRQIPTRKSVQAGEPDRLAALLDEAASEVERLAKKLTEAADYICGEKCTKGSHCSGCVEVRL